MCVYFSLSILFKGTLPCGVQLFQYSRSVGKSKAKIKILVVLLNVVMIVCFILYYQPWLLTCFKAINFLCTAVYKAFIHTVTIFHANIDLKKNLLFPRDLTCMLVAQIAKSLFSDYSYLLFHSTHPPPTVRTCTQVHSVRPYVVLATCPRIDFRVNYVIL